MGYQPLGPSVGIRNLRGQGDGIVNLNEPIVSVQNRRGLGGGGNVAMGPNVGQRSSN